MPIYSGESRQFTRCRCSWTPVPYTLWYLSHQNGSNIVQFHTLVAYFDGILSFLAGPTGGDCRDSLVRQLEKLATNEGVHDARNEGY